MNPAGNSGVASRHTHPPSTSLLVSPFFLLFLLLLLFLPVSAIPRSRSQGLPERPACIKGYFKVQSSFGLSWFRLFIRPFQPTGTTRLVRRSCRDRYRIRSRCRSSLGSITELQLPNLVLRFAALSTISDDYIARSSRALGLPCLQLARSFVPTEQFFLPSRSSTVTGFSRLSDSCPIPVRFLFDLGRDRS